MTAHRTLYDTPGAPGPTPHCPTCGQLLRCKECGFTIAPHRKGVKEGWLDRHGYDDGTGAA